MNATTILMIHSRRLLPRPTTAATLRSNQAQPPLSPATTPVAATEAAAEAASRDPPFSLNSSLTLTILVLLTAIFFMGFFSFFISRSTAASHHQSAPSTASDLRGIHPSVLGSLPLTAFSGETAKTEGCSICLSEFSEGENVKLIPNCGHVFHPRCVDTWLSAHVTCPLCRRSPQLFKKENEEESTCT